MIFYTKSKPKSANYKINQFVESTKFEYIKNKKKVPNGAY